MTFFLQWYSSHTQAAHRAQIQTAISRRATQETGCACTCWSIELVKSGAVTFRSNSLVGKIFSTSAARNTSCSCTGIENRALDTLHFGSAKKWENPAGHMSEDRDPLTHVVEYMTSVVENKNYQPLPPRERYHGARAGSRRQAETATDQCPRKRAGRQ